MKVEAAFHFIDAWSGQTAFMKLKDSNTYLWTDSFDFTQTKNSLNICGSEVGEGKFTVNIESIIPKSLVSGDSLRLEFGSTLETDPEYSSWGISSLRLSIRFLICLR